MKFRLISFAASVALCAVASVPAFADSISVFNTGSNGVAALSTGTTDTHYTVVSSPAGPTSAVAAVANPNWASNTSTADWINAAGTGDVNSAPGVYDYQTTFSLAGDDPTTARLSGMFAGDNSVCITLNGTATGICTTDGTFGSLSPFSINSGFVSGNNTLDFIVTNDAGNPTPSGLIAEVAGTANAVGTVSAVPEPSSLLLLGTGLAGAAMFYRRSRRAI